MWTDRRSQLCHHLKKKKKKQERFFFIEFALFRPHAAPQIIIQQKYWILDDSAFIISFQILKILILQQILLLLKIWKDTRQLTMQPMPILVVHQCISNIPWQLECDWKAVKTTFQHFQAIFFYDKRLWTSGKTIKWMEIM